MSQRILDQAYAKLLEASELLQEFARTTKSMYEIRRRWNQGHLGFDWVVFKYEPGQARKEFRAFRKQREAQNYLAKLEASENPEPTYTKGV